MGTLLRPTLVLLVAFSVLTGLIYPAVVTGVAQVVFPHQANGSLVQEGGKVLGSELIGQPFASPNYFWSRPSATTPYAYNAGASSGSNLGPLNPALTDAVKQRVEAVRRADPEAKGLVPVDLVTTSASGLDPHISPAAAYYQVARVASARRLAEARVRTLVDQAVEDRTFGLLGEPRVNVLLLNRALDKAGGGT